MFTNGIFKHTAFCKYTSIADNNRLLEVVKCKNINFILGKIIKLVISKLWILFVCVMTKDKMRKMSV